MNTPLPEYPTYSWIRSVAVFSTAFSLLERRLAPRQRYFSRHVLLNPALKPALL